VCKLIVAYPGEFVVLTVNREQHKSSYRYLMRFVSVLYLSYPKLVALIQSLIQLITKGAVDEGSYVSMLAIFKSNNWIVITFMSTYIEIFNKGKMSLPLLSFLLIFRPAPWINLLGKPVYLKSIVVYKEIELPTVNYADCVLRFRHFDEFSPFRMTLGTFTVLQ
jgi:hypothetical protein